MCNELVALKQRHQYDSGLRYRSNANLGKYLKPFIKRLTPCSEDHIISRCAGSKRKLMIRAKESLREYDVEDADGKVRMFLKADKAHEEYGTIPSYGAPRCIQYRNKRYCLRLATFLHPVEEHVYGMLDQSKTPIFAKSRNLVQRGMDLYEKFSHFNDPVILCLDHSKFDAHVGLELLRLEHTFYKRCYSSEDRQELSYLLHMQNRASGGTKNGTHYKTVGTRMSGDQNTGLGNSIINYAMLADFAKQEGLNACFYVDGDDSVIICENPHRAVSPAFFEQFGMSTKLEACTTKFCELEFCQTRPVWDGVQWRMVRNPARLIARLQWAVQNITVGGRGKYLRSIGLCEMALGVGLPVGQYLGHLLSKQGKGYMVTGNHYAAQREFQRPQSVSLIPPTMEARLGYEETWGIPVSEQLEIERTGLTNPTIDESWTAEAPYRDR